MTTTGLPSTVDKTLAAGPHYVLFNLSLRTLAYIYRFRILVVGKVRAFAEHQLVFVTNNFAERCWKVVSHQLCLQHEFKGA